MECRRTEFWQERKGPLCSRHTTSHILAQAVCAICTGCQTDSYSGLPLMMVFIMILISAALFQRWLCCDWEKEMKKIVKERLKLGRNTSFPGKPCPMKEKGGDYKVTIRDSAWGCRYQFLQAEGGGFCGFMPAPHLAVRDMVRQISLQAGRSLLEEAMKNKCSTRICGTLRIKVASLSWEERMEESLRGSQKTERKERNLWQAVYLALWRRDRFRSFFPRADSEKYTGGLEKTT